MSTNENDFNQILETELDLLQEDLDLLGEDLDFSLNEAIDITSGSTVITGGETTFNSGIGILDAGSGDNVRIAYKDEAGTEIFGFERPQALLNIFNSQYYTEENPDVAASIANKYQDSSLSINLQEAELPELAPSGSTQINTTGGGTVITGGIVATEVIPEYTAAIEHYVSFGANEGRNPSPLFDVDYYLEQNPDVATAVAGRSFEGDALLHYVTFGASEGRDPNAYFDTSYYVEQNLEVAESGLNPLEHYVLYGSSSGADPSPNFDPQQYLAENPDVATAGIDPLTHFLTSGSE